MRRRFRNPLAYPAGVNPGVDFSHPAARGLRFSGVASSGGANFINLLQATKGAITGTPSFDIDGSLGQVFRCTGGTDQATFSGQSTVNDTGATIAAIVRFRGVAALQGIFSSSSNASAAGLQMYLNTPFLCINMGGIGAFNSTTAPLALVPYLFIASVNNSPRANFLALRLDTGQVLIDTVTSAARTPNAPDGTYVVGNDGPGDTANADIAAVMFSANFMSLSEMRNWAADPWAFWYPPQAEMQIATSGVTPPVTAVLYQLMNVG